MKINGSGQPPVAGIPGQEAPAGPPDSQATGSQATGGVGPASGAGPASKAQKTGPSFAETVAGPAAAGPAGTSAVERPGGVAVHDLAAAVKSGQLDPRSAVDKVIDRIVTAQLGPDAPTQVRDKVQSALRDALDDDPLLADKLRSL